MITDERLRWLSGPDYNGTEPGEIAAELLAARERIATQKSVIEIDIREYTKLETRLDAARDLITWLPITTEELIRLRNANKITFDKQVNSITTCLIQLRECLTEETKGEQDGT